MGKTLSTSIAAISPIRRKRNSGKTNKQTSPPKNPQTNKQTKSINQQPLTPTWSINVNTTGFNDTEEGKETLYDKCMKKKLKLCTGKAVT